MIGNINDPITVAEEKWQAWREVPCIKKALEIYASRGETLRDLLECLCISIPIEFGIGNPVYNIKEYCTPERETDQSVGYTLGRLLVDCLFNQAIYMKYNPDERLREYWVATDKLLGRHIEELTNLHKGGGLLILEYIKQSSGVKES